ncbi:outer membrane beta-barrel protein [candidate division KSB1 bacterium]|nr:outer membrane beta-barrel protein [candidate division KSB1 bacterium]
MAMILRSYKYVIFFLLSLLVADTAHAQPVNYFDKVSVGIELGNWVPNNISRLNTSSALKIQKEAIYTALSLQIPINSNLIFRFTGGYFYYEGLDDTGSEYCNRAITITPILVDIKYLLLNDMKITPYVSYGISTNFGFEDTDHFSFLTDKYDHFSVGINLGTGFDFLITRHLSVGLEFRYHYLEFPENFIFTNNYSGTKINIALCYLF